MEFTAIGIKESRIRLFSSFEKGLFKDIFTT